jgi:hypothetical protein
VSPLLKAIVPLMDHRDKDVREHGKKLIIEVPLCSQRKFVFVDAQIAFVAGANTTLPSATGGSAR